MKKSALVILMLGSMIGSFSHAADFPTLRNDVSKMAAQTPGLVGSCDQVTPVAENLRVEFNTLKANLNAFRDVNPDIQLAVHYIDQGIEVLDMSAADCQNNPEWNRVKILEDMYLEHIDTQLMIASQAVGSSLK